MNDIDNKIKEALDVEDRELLDQFGEQGLIAQSLSVFQGRQGWIAGVAMIASVIIFAGAIYAGWQFFNAPAALESAQWAAVAWFLMTMVAFMKVWFWMRMESNRVIREVKRVELQIARLQDKPMV